MSSQSTAAVELTHTKPINESPKSLHEVPKRDHSKKPARKIHAPGFVRQPTGYIALFTSWLAGLLYAPALGQDPDSMLALSLSMVIVAIFFLIQEPVALLENAFREDHPYRKRWQPYAWLGVLFGGLLATGIPLISMRPGIYWLAIPALGLLATYLLLRRLGANQIILSMVGFAALAVAAPIGRVAAYPGYSWQELASIWILPAAFFSLTIMTLHIRRTGASAVKPALYYAGLLVTLIGLLIAFHIMPWIAMAVILVQVVKLGYIATGVEQYRRWPIGSANMLETSLAVLFLLLNAVH